MNRFPIVPDLNVVPTEFHRLLSDSAVYDSSCSPEARVYFIDRDGGYFLKSAPKGALAKEAAMVRFFHSKLLSAKVIGYTTAERDWLLTTAIPGEDCLYPMYLDDPVRLCDTTAELLRMLHGTDFSGCPVPERTADYLNTAYRNYEAGRYDHNLFPDNWGYASAEEAIRVIEDNARYLKTDTLLHGDYCLPNILLNNWKFSGFIDLASGGVGDRHIDLFWGIWSLHFNLKTDRYRNRFLDAYGRNDVEEALFPVISAIEVFQ